MSEKQQDALSQDWVVQELAFRSHTAVVGSLIARLRSVWYSVAAKWAIRHIIAQQNQINQLIRHALHDQATWLTTQDKELVALRQQLAEVTVQLVQAQQRIEKLEQSGTEGIVKGE